VSLAATPARAGAGLSEGFTPRRGTIAANLQWSDKVMYTLKGLKSWRGREGYGFQVKLVADGKVIAEVTDEAHGGQIRWDSRDDAALRAFGVAHGLVAPSDGSDVPTPNDLYSSRTGWEKELEVEEVYATAICTMVDALENEQRNKKQVRRWCKTETVFRLPDDKEGAYRTVKAVYAPPVRKFILQKYGPTVIILNEHL
jgi:hypothetical protein